MKVLIKLLDKIKKAPTSKSRAVLPCVHNIRQKDTNVNHYTSSGKYSMQKRAKNYFILADQYFQTSKLLLSTLINNNNSNFGIANTMEEAERKMRENSLKSDLTLFVPALFTCYQSIELFSKGLILLNNIEFERTHEISTLIIMLKSIYGEEAIQYKELKNFHRYQVGIIKKFKKENSITTMHELYDALRYPENVDNTKKYDYFSLKYNGNLGKAEYKTILKKISRVRKIVNEEYRLKEYI